MGRLRGSYVLFKEAYGPIPAGTHGYCIEDIYPCNEHPEGVLRFQLDRPVLGMYEFKLTHSAKENIVIRG